MIDRAAVEERLRRKELEIQSLEEKLRAARIYLQALRDVLKVGQLAENRDQGGVSADVLLRPGSAVALARDAILARGKPVHINELLGIQGKELTRESRASLTSSLSAYVRRGEIFTRPAPNTFGLIELGHDHSETGPPNEPPRGFGQSTPMSVREIDDSIPF